MTSFNDNVSDGYDERAPIVARFVVHSSVRPESVGQPVESIAEYSNPMVAGDHVPPR
jgi:hypothetical protein